MEFIIIFAGVFTVLGLWNMLIAVLGLFPKFHCKAIGVLTKTNIHKNTPGRHFVIPVLTKYVYTYEVKNKTYKYSREIRTKRRLPPKTVFVYVKWFPRHAYPHKFKGINEWIMGTLYLIMGICFLVLAFYCQ